MAISTTLSVHFKCGHSETKGFPFTLPGKRKTKGFGPGRNLVCSRSFKASRRDELGEHHQDQLIRVQGFDGDHGLSGLAGSDKQVRGGRASAIGCSRSSSTGSRRAGLLSTLITTAVDEDDLVDAGNPI